ncbi:MAG: gliding motility-associated C-terminal domain-containing protein [Saprospiraceae bacterium]|nr:gliding motility-associated C-terminal domain-containing protein [Saprospiraceae bacterium]
MISDFRMASIKIFNLALLILLTNYVNGQFNKAILLNGCDNCLQIENSATTLQDIKELTIEAWIYANCSDENRIIIGKEWCNGENSFYLSINAGKLFWNTSKSGFCTTTDILQSKDVVIPVNSFTHIAVVRDNSSTKFFVNGNEVSSVWIRGSHNSIYSSNEPIRIGCYKKLNGEFSNYFSGLIDNVRIWNKALTLNELRNSLSNLMTGNETNLIVNLEMEGMQIGQNLSLPNKSNVYSTLIAKAFIYNSHSPYCISKENYDQIEIDLGPDKFICNNQQYELRHNLQFYKDIIWQDNSSTHNYYVSKTGKYNVRIETELCRFLEDTISIAFHPPDTTFLQYTVCQGELLQINGFTYDSPGTFLQSIQSVYGCDSLISIDIRHFPLTQENKFFSLNDAKSFTINGITYEKEGSYIQYFIDENGCIAILNITLIANKYECSIVDTEKCFINKPFPTVNFAINKLFESSASTAIYQSPLLFDMNNDCVPEIIMSGITGFQTSTRITSGISIVNSTDGETVSTIPTPYYSWGGPTTFALADINFDGLAEIVVATANDSQNPSNLRGRLVCYDSFGNRLWISNDTYGDFTGSLGSGGSPAFADFNQDGIPEVYIYNEIFNAQTGVKLAEGGFNGIGQASRSFNAYSYSTTIAADLDDDVNTLELAAGYSVYKVEITNTAGKNGNSMTAYNLTVDNNERDGYTSIGDINLDNKLDVIISSQGLGNNSRLYVYSLQNDVPVLIAKTSMPSSFGGCCPEASGAAFVGDINGNGSPVIGVTRPYLLLTYKYNGTTSLQENWRLSTNDESGTTGMTMFDFNQDGVQEIVYRDENFLRIINGSVQPPVDLSTFSCVSGTGSEYPIVGDIDNTGESKICVACASSGSRNRGKMTIFASPRNRQFWAPSRGIWNQYNYHVLNINDDLTVPQKQKNNATETNGRLNNFLVQASLLDPDGNFLQTATNIAGEITCLTFDSISNLYKVTFNVSNLPTATASFQNTLKIAFFNGNPATTGTLIGVYNVNLPMPPGKIIAGLTYTFSAFNLSNLFMVLNTDGMTTGMVYTSDQFLVDECEYQNNFIVSASILKTKTINSFLCTGDSLFFDGVYLKNSGEYTQIKTSINGCDTVTKLHLKVVNKIEITTPVNTCIGDSVRINGFWIFSDTIISSLDISSFGCDSIHQYVITFSPPQINFREINLCYGDSIFVNNNWIYDNYTLKDTLQNLPCPIFSTTTYLFSPKYFINQKYTICPEDSIYLHNTWIQSAGEYQFPFQTAKMCDSIITVEITQIDTPSEPDFEVDCDKKLYYADIEENLAWSIKWSNGSTSTNTIYQDSTEGNVILFHPENGCEITYNFNLKVIPGLDDMQFFDDTTIYPGKPLQLSLPLSDSVWNVRWSPARLMSCDTCFSNTITTRESAEIILDLYHVTGCDFRQSFDITTDASSDINIPNVFAPDSGIPNNLWTWSIPDCFYVLDVKVYDRWGNLVFNRKNPNGISWDGTFNGEILQQGVYTYLTTYKTPDGFVKNKYGDVTIILIK